MASRPASTSGEAEGRLTLEAMAVACGVGDAATAPLVADRADALLVLGQGRVGPAANAWRRPRTWAPWPTSRPTKWPTSPAGLSPPARDRCPSQATRLGCPAVRFGTRAPW